MKVDTKTLFVYSFYVSLVAMILVATFFVTIFVEWFL